MVGLGNAYWFVRAGQVRLCCDCFAQDLTEQKINHLLTLMFKTFIPKPILKVDPE